jgi:hypothetical protein
MTTASTEVLLLGAAGNSGHVTTRRAWAVGT